MINSLPMGEGRPGSRVMLVADCWGFDEERVRKPLQGYSGQLLSTMLHSAGIMRSECYATCLVNARPPRDQMSSWVAMKRKAITPFHKPLRDLFALPIVHQGYANLLREINLVNPNVIITVGDASLWALYGVWGSRKWRGSELLTDEGRKLIPTLAPKLALADYSLRPIIINDLKRAAKEASSVAYPPKTTYNFHIRPSLNTVLSTLSMLEDRAKLGAVWIDFDLETSPKHIVCAGISWSLTEGLCIPITQNGHGEHYWSEDEEAFIVYRLYKLLTNPQVFVRGQNLLYDCQHTYRWWHFVPNVKQDTMISWHCMYSGMRKSLALQASLLCDRYEFWKDLAKDPSNKMGA